MCEPQLSQRRANGPGRTAQHGGKRESESPACQHAAPCSLSPEPGHLQERGPCGELGCVPCGWGCACRRGGAVRAGGAGPFSEKWY